MRADSTSCLRRVSSSALPSQPAPPLSTVAIPPAFHQIPGDSVVQLYQKQSMGAVFEAVRNPMWGLTWGVLAWCARVWGRRQTAVHGHRDGPSGSTLSPLLPALPDLLSYLPPICPPTDHPIYPLSALPSSIPSAISCPTCSTINCAIHCSIFSATPGGSDAPYGARRRAG